MLFPCMCLETPGGKDRGSGGEAGEAGMEMEGSLNSADGVELQRHESKSGEHPNTCYNHK